MEVVLEELEPKDGVPIEEFPMEVHGRVGWDECKAVLPRVVPKEVLLRAALA